MRLRRILSCFALALVTIALAVPAQAQAPVEAGPVMVWELPESYAPTGPVALKIEVLKDGEALFSETARLDLAGLNGDRAIELLAGAPEARSLAATLFERGNTIIEVAIHLEGEERARLPLSAVLAGADSDLQDLQLVPLQYTQGEADRASEPDIAFIMAAGTDCSARDACRQQCWDDYYTCVEHFCDSSDPYQPPSRILPEECDFCSDDRFTCEFACPPCECVDPKSVTYSNSSTVVGSSVIGFECVEDWDPYDYWGKEYQYLQRLYKVTTYKHTEACDGTVTTTVDSVTYEYGYCWQSTFYSCYGPNPYASTYPRCY